MRPKSIVFATKIEMKTRDVIGFLCLLIISFGFVPYAWFSFFTSLKYFKK